MATLFDFADDDPPPEASVEGENLQTLATQLDPTARAVDSGVRVAGPEVPSRGTGQVAPASSYRDGLIEQIKRDMAVLQEDPIYWEPSREFYEQRIESYRQAVKELDERSRGTSPSP